MRAPGLAYRVAAALHPAHLAMDPHTRMLPKYREGGRGLTREALAARTGGHRDTAKPNAKKTGAQAQLDTQRSLLERASRGQTRIRLRLRQGDVDITEMVDLSNTGTEATRGPAGKADFKHSLGLTARDLKALVEDLTREALAARNGGRGV